MKARRFADVGITNSIGLAQKVYEGLRSEILSGKLKPGERLSRRRIAQRYGCSYTPVIEALVRLEYSGLVESESSQMSRVRTISVETIQGTYVLREACETQAIRMACEVATDSEIDELYRLAAEVEAYVLENLDAAADKTGARASTEGPLLHWRFHRRIAEISQSQVLVRELERIELLRRLQANWIYLEEMVDPPRHHSLLVDAIRARDPVTADAAMRAHVRRGLEKELKGYWAAVTRE